MPYGTFFLKKTDKILNLKTNNEFLYSFIRYICCTRWINGNNKVTNNSTMTDNEPKWDYTTKEGNFAAGAAVVGGNLLVLIVYILYRTVPSVHHFIIGR